MKRLSMILMVAASSLVLVACGSNNKLGTNSGSNKTQLTGSDSSSNYQSLIKDGHYQVSKSSGVDDQQTSNQFNLQGFQHGLLDISKKEFSPDKYVFQEGQEISTETTQNWLGRKSKDNPDGLNPEQPKKKVVPEYLQQIDEQDYLQPEGGKMKLKGMTVGLGLNSIYYYTKEKYGAQYSKKLDSAEIEKQGKELANIVLARLRKQKDLKNIPIVIALYKAAPDDSLVGGNFFAYSVNNPGSDSVSSWNKIDQKNYVFPTTNGEKAPNANDETAFNQFKEKAQSYFPNLSGITAQAQYTNGSLTGMHIDVTTQFYSYTEINSFTQYLQTSAEKYLPQNTPIEINVGSTNGVQSYLSRSKNAKKFSAHVFNNY
ncbi:CamS family sex pheromone protein [Fructilactobacillus lindneri]|uniref:CamS family sex pheromone protein n=1 Tax=Fructilactobacillus lindneri TaxID=53444 RepID=UPI0009D1202C|nr:CamS family sex pheromone protein [Fructilactobacillus lindneri]SJZ91607.1 Protein involved in sex pheromone biosynthesis [Fructilactobacillus lindneri DSM 20690 = JCM 11027]